MPDDNHTFSDFLNEDNDELDNDEFDVEQLARQFEENDFFGADSDEDSADSSDQTEGAESYDAAEEFGDDFEVSPNSILEGMLFVGNEENQPLSAEKMSSLMRGVSADEIDDLVADLNESYRASNSPFEIIYEDDGYRLVLAKGYEFCRQRFYREEKAATLSQSVVDVLALVAYLQPVTRKQIEEKKLKPCGSILNQLVRRRLIEIERQKIDNKNQITYRTTDRFLDLFDLDSLDELPKSQTFESPD